MPAPPVAVVAALPSYSTRAGVSAFERVSVGLSRAILPSGGYEEVPTEETAVTEQRVDLADPSLYVNREISALRFFERVLEEAEEPDLPLLERVKFLSILGSIQAEFFMVRVASLKPRAAAGRRRALARRHDAAGTARGHPALGARSHGPVAAMLPAPGGRPRPRRGPGGRLRRARRRSSGRGPGSTSRTSCSPC